MNQLLKMAWRDILRNRRRSFLSALGLGMGLALLMMMASVLTGEMRGSMETTIRLQSGHLQLRSAEYAEEKTSLNWDNLIENPNEVTAQVAALPEVQVATPRLFASGMLAKGSESAGVRIIGVDPASTANDPYRDGLVSGQFLTADDRDGILIGEALAKKLNLSAGDQLYLLINTSAGDVAEQPFTIRGVYTTHTPPFDQLNIFMPIEKAQAIAGAKNHASTIFVLLKDRDQLSSVIAALPKASAGGGAYQVQTYEQANELLAQTEQMSRAYMRVLYLIVLAVTATVIINALVMSVFERTREIGILAAIGMKARRIMAMFFIESSLLAIGGIIIGVALGSLLVLYSINVGFYIGDIGLSSSMLLGERIYGYPTMKDYISLAISAFAVTLIGSLYPALLAARMEPVEALHGGQ